VLGVPVAANAVLLDSLPADSVVTETLNPISSWTVKNSSGNHATEPKDRAVQDSVRQEFTHDLGGLSGINAGNKRSNKAPHKGWREYIAASGRLYYHHKATNTTQWKNPF